MSAVFDQLNQGSSVTAVLRKVDKSEVTHKDQSALPPQEANRPYLPRNPNQRVCEPRSLRERNWMATNGLSRISTIPDRKSSKSKASFLTAFLYRDAPSASSKLPAKQTPSRSTTAPACLFWLNRLFRALMSSNLPNFRYRWTVSSLR